MYTHAFFCPCPTRWDLSLGHLGACEISAVDDLGELPAEEFKRPAYTALSRGLQRRPQRLLLEAPQGPASRVVFFANCWAIKLFHSFPLFAQLLGIISKTAICFFPILSPDSDCELLQPSHFVVSICGTWTTCSGTTSRCSRETQTHPNSWLVAFQCVARCCKIGNPLNHLKPSWGPVSGQAQLKMCGSIPKPRILISQVPHLLNETNLQRSPSEYLPLRWLNGQDLFRIAPKSPDKTTVFK